MSEKSWWEAAADVNCPSCKGTGQIVLHNDGDDERSECGICDCVGETPEPIPPIIAAVGLAWETQEKTEDE